MVILKDYTNINMEKYLYHLLGPVTEFFFLEVSLCSIFKLMGYMIVYAIPYRSSVLVLKSISNKISNLITCAYDPLLLVYPSRDDLF